MPCRAAAALILVAAAAGSTGCSSNEEHRAPAAQAGNQNGAERRPFAVTVTPVVPVEPYYPATVRGLESLMGALVKALQEDDAAEQSRLLLSLRLPEPGKWFRDEFGAELGPRLLAEHEPLRTGIGWLARHIEAHLEAGLVSIHCDRFDAPGAPGAVGYQRQALARMKQLVPLYSVRFSTSDGKKTWHVWSFVHNRGTFRYVGKMRKVES